MHARSALFDLYGDHLRSRGDHAPVASLVRILAPIGITAPAVRTAISRMVRQGWLEPAQLREGRGYALTDRARMRLDAAGDRIYGTRATRWSGAWDLLVVAPPASRSARERVRSGLRFLGYAPLSDSTWISPFRSPEVDAMLANERTAWSRFAAQDTDPRARVREAWDLDALASAYHSWHESAICLLGDFSGDFSGDFAGDLDVGSDQDATERAFAVRSHLVHEWRKFLFTDPGLPAELLPPDWPGRSAARFFAQEASRLLPAASLFVDRCLRSAAP